MKLPDEIFKLRPFPVILLTRRVSCVRCKKSNRVVAPVIQKRPAADFTFSHRLVEFKHRHQLNRSDAKRLQVGDFFPDTLKRSRKLHARGGMLCKTAHMHLINNQLLHRLFRLSGVTPVEIVEHHPPMITLLPVGLFSPDALLRHRPRIRIQKHFCFIINQPFFRDVRPVHPIGVLKIVNIQTEHDHRIYPPDPVIFRKRNRPVRLFFPSVKQQQLTGNRILRMNCKIDAASEGSRSVDFI